MTRNILIVSIILLGGFLTGTNAINTAEAAHSKKTYGAWHRTRVSGWLNIGKTQCWRYYYTKSGRYVQRKNGVPFWASCSKW